MTAGEAVVSACITDDGDGVRARLLGEHGADADAIVRLSLRARNGERGLSAWMAGKPSRRNLQPFDPACPLVELDTDGPGADAARLEGMRSMP